jgi:ABC-type multidrug transport system fused ATPase/permease subunit
MRLIPILLALANLVLFCGCETAQDRYQNRAVASASSAAGEAYDAKLARINEAAAKTATDRDHWRHVAEDAERKAVADKEARDEDTRQATVAAKMAEETTDRHLCFLVGFVAALAGVALIYCGTQLPLIASRLRTLGGLAAAISAACFGIMPLIGNHWVAPAIGLLGVAGLAGWWILHHGADLHRMAASVATTVEVDAEALVPKVRAAWHWLLDHLHRHGDEMPVNPAPGMLVAMGTVSGLPQVDINAPMPPVKAAPPAPPIGGSGVTAAPK